MTRKNFNIIFLISLIGILGGKSHLFCQNNLLGINECMSPTSICDGMQIPINIHCINSTQGGCSGTNDMWYSFIVHDESMSIELNLSNQLSSVGSMGSWVYTMQRFQIAVFGAYGNCETPCSELFPSNNNGQIPDLSQAVYFADVSSDNWVNNELGNESHFISLSDLTELPVAYPARYLLWLFYTPEGPGVDVEANLNIHADGLQCVWEDEITSNAYNICNNHYNLAPGYGNSTVFNGIGSDQHEIWLSSIADSTQVFTIDPTAFHSIFNPCDFGTFSINKYGPFQQCDDPCEILANSEITPATFTVNSSSTIPISITNVVTQGSNPVMWLYQLTFNNSCPSCNLNLSYDLSDGMSSWPEEPTYSADCEDCLPTTELQPEKPYVLSLWVKEEDDNDGVNDLEPWSQTFYEPGIKIILNPGTTEEVVVGPVYPTTPSTAEVQVYASPIIEGWQLLEITFTTPEEMSGFSLEFLAEDGPCYFDDIRMFPKDGSMKSYVYDPQNLRFVAELDERHFATLYEYDEEGRLMRVKKETERGIMTIQESKTSTVKRNN
jgi:hypothetical protein